MQWEGSGYILSVRNHGETSSIINILTEDQGRYAGLVRGGRSRRMRPILQPGNRVSVSWHARLSEHLGAFNIEALDARASLIMTNREALAGLNSACVLLMQVLPEREAHANLYRVFEVLLESFTGPDIWPKVYVRFEIAVLQALGYGLDLSSCAATGTSENLTHVSPRSGRAVSAGAAAPYLDKMLALPKFLGGDRAESEHDLNDGFALSGYFLESRVFHANNKPLPDAREYLINRLQSIGII